MSLRADRPQTRGGRLKRTGTLRRQRLTRRRTCAAPYFGDAAVPCDRDRSSKLVWRRAFPESFPLLCAARLLRDISVSDVPKIRILVLTSSTGGGHDARAEAFAEWCFQLYRHDIEVRIEQMLEQSSIVNRAGVRIYNRIQRSAPWVHKAFYAMIEGLSVLNKRRVT